jgi:adenylate cyclase
MQRYATRMVVKRARKNPGEPLSPEDWEAYWSLAAETGHRAFSKMLGAMPSNPRCGYCGAPFGGVGGRMLRPLGYRPSRKNPSICDVCVEASPPGGMSLEIGVLFADVRGFTTLSEGRTSHEVSLLLRRFYKTAREVLWPEAMIDKLIGDEVMALYLPHPKHRHDAYDARLAATMLRHARGLLEGVGYGTAEGPFLDLGVGLDFGEAFVGNIGDGAVQDFTAVGDVVNTASRLTGEARGGEIVLSERLAAVLDDPPGEPCALTVKGKAAPVPARRLAV